MARKIAAGEVIERPASVVRELLDNAIDAGADSLELEIQSGGIESIRLRDNGSGIAPADLPTCVLPHATSKISRVEDLERVASLGFRGEALASIAAVARLEITSREAGSDTAARLTVEAGKAKPVKQVPASPGTTVVVSNLFYCVPARKKFLKHTGAETAAVRATLLERATAFPQLQFRFTVDGNLKAFYPTATRPERVSAALGGGLVPERLHEIHGTGPDFEVTAVLAGPEQFRRDRKQIQIFVNRRRITEFAFVQAVEHAFSEFMPGGRFPIACVFIECAPEIIDFNVHPAKKEVRFRTKADIRRRVVDLIREYLHAYERSLHVAARKHAEAGPGSSRGPWPPAGASPAPSRSGAPFTPGEASGSPLPAPELFETVSGLSAAERAIFVQTGRRPGSPPETLPAAQAPTDAPERTGAEAEAKEFRYLGPIYGVFLLLEHRGRLLILDQHAAHERILYERFRKQRRSQRLLVSIEFEVSKQQERRLRETRGAWAEIGVALTPAGAESGEEPLAEPGAQQSAGRWRIDAVPHGLQVPEDVLIEAVLEAAPHLESLSDRFYAELACKAAVRDGDPLEPSAAEQLIAEALRLPHPRCPHGRPLWVEITREELYRRVQRE